jgi:hypothetical protein
LLCILNAAPEGDIVVTAKTTTPQQPMHWSNDEIKTLEQNAGAYYLIRNAILQNKRLCGDIVQHWLRQHGYVLIRKDEVEAALLASDPRLGSLMENVEAKVQASQGEVEQGENQLIDLVRQKGSES